jgi:hypothetical protein
LADNQSEEQKLRLTKIGMLEDFKRIQLYSMHRQAGQSAPGDN